MTDANKQNCLDGFKTLINNVIRCQDELETYRGLKKEESLSGFSLQLSKMMTNDTPEAKMLAAKPKPLPEFKIKLMRQNTPIEDSVKVNPECTYNLRNCRKTRTQLKLSEPKRSECKVQSETESEDKDDLSDHSSFEMP